MKKKYLLTGLLAVLYLQVISQTMPFRDYKDEIEQQILSDDSVKFCRTEYPAKWKDESAVILYQKSVFFGENYSGRYSWSGWNHRRIKILDKAAVERFSELMFLESNSHYLGFNFFSVSVIKANGTIIQVNPDQVVKIEGSELEDGQIVESAINYEKSTSSFAKVPISSIEVGDIVDYYCFNNLTALPSAFSSTPFTEIWLSVEYPIVSQSIEYNLNTKFSYNLKSINGAPPIQTESPGRSVYGEPKTVLEKYLITDSSREKISEEMFLIYKKLIPQIKLEIGAKKNNSFYKYNSRFIFCAEVSGVEYTVQSSDIQAFYSKLEDPHVTDEILLKKIGGIIKEKCPNGSSIEKAKLLFYKARNTNVNNYEGVTRIFILSQVLSKLKIEHQVLAVIPNNIGSIENVMSPYELIPAICVKDSCGTELFLFAPVRNRNVNEYSYQIDGADAFVYFPRSTYKLNAANKCRMPEMRKMPRSNPSDNVLNTILDVTFDEKNDQINVSSESQITGYHKQQIIDVILFGYEFFLEEMPVLGISKTNVFLSEQEMERKKDESARKTKLREEFLKKILDQEYEVDTLLNTEILNSSVFYDPELRYSQEFTVKNMFSKVGKNILFDLGKLIGSQISLEEKELKRENDIYYPYPCIYSYNITVTLPDGYNAENFDAFNVSINNSCMSLQSQVTADSNQLHFTFRKEYKNSFDTKDKWPEYVEVLEAAYKITQQKIVLKPLN